MAYEVVMANSTFRAKHRNPWGVLGLSLVTLGIYNLVWWYKINRELRDLGRSLRSPELGDEPTLSVLAYSIGSWIVIPYVWTIVTTNKRIQRAQRLTGTADHLNGWVVGLLWVFTLGLGAWVYMQSQLNKVWETPGMEPAYGPMVGPAAGALPTAAPDSDLDRLQKLTELRNAGALTDEEFEAEKAKALGGSGTPPGSQTWTPPGAPPEKPAAEGETPESAPADRPHEGPTAGGDTPERPPEQP